MTDPWTASSIPDQAGRTIVVTGATSGLGLASATELARAGARVLMAGRNAEKAARARDEVAAVATGPEPEVVSLDLADLASVREAAEDVRGRVATLDVLVNNAGVMALPLQRTAQGFEMQMGTNHFGHFALTGLLLPTLLAADAPRVVTVSSGFHRAGRMRWHDVHWRRRYSRWLAYGQSKLANLLFTFELDRRAVAAGTALASVAAHPGYAATHLQTAGPEASGRALSKRAMELGNVVIAQPCEDGALPQLYAATMPEVAGGDYFGPGRLFELRGHPVPVGTIRRARDEADARRLWELSERLTEVAYTWPGRDEDEDPDGGRREAAGSEAG